MKRIFIVIFAILSLTTLAQQRKVAVYVTGDGVGINKVLGSKLVSAIARSEEYSAIERTESFLTELSKEQNYQRTGAVDDSELSRIGKQFGVQYVCVADVTDVYGEKYISARLINVETAEIVNAYDGGGRISSLGDCVRIANEIAEKLARTEEYTKAYPHQTPLDNPKAVSDKRDGFNNAYSPIKELYKKDPKWEDNPTITEECLINIALFHEAVKNKQYAEAYEPWRQVYTSCPNANKAIYADGSKILKWKYEQSSNTTEKK